MDIRTVQFKDINPAEYNPRVISDENLAGLRKSIEKFGQVANLVVNKDGTLISGHQRMKAMEQMGLTEARAYVVDVDKTTEKQLNILMNSGAMQGDFDELKLSEVIEELKGHEDYDALRITEMEPLDLSEMEFGDVDEPEETGGGGDLFVKKVVINLSDYGLAVLMKKLDAIGEDPSELYQRVLERKFNEELSGE